MNDFSASLVSYEGDNVLDKDGISFTNVCVISITVDWEDLYSKPGFIDSLIVYEELISSLKADGKYLIFTCACGVAEDGGWDGVSVRHFDGSVIWEIETEFGKEVFLFDSMDYAREIERLSFDLKSLGHLTLEPSFVVYPDYF